MSWAQSFVVKKAGYMNRLELDNNVEFDYDPPVWLEAEVEYAFDVETGDLFQIIAGDYMERMPNPSPACKRGE